MSKLSERLADALADVTVRLALARSSIGSVYKIAQTVFVRFSILWEAKPAGAGMMDAFSAKNPVLVVSQKSVFVVTLHPFRSKSAFYPVRRYMLFVEWHHFHASIFGLGVFVPP